MDIDINDRSQVYSGCASMSAPEWKAGIAGSERLVTYDELMRTVEAFRQANDERVAERRSHDVVLEEKVDRSRVVALERGEGLGRP